MSEYGKQSAYKIAYELSAAGVLTVSGKAKGIDGVAACGALAAGGETVAVLGCGIDRVYPSEHKKLMSEIVRHGAVITEYPPKEAPHGYNFPKRNRIISGLCQGVLVVEAPIGSGALITAREAIAQGRELFALPGNIDDVGAQGPNELIKDGAYTVLSSADVLEHYSFLYGDTYDEKALVGARRKAVLAEAALKKYGISYASEVKRRYDDIPVAAEESPKAEKAEEAKAPVAEPESNQELLAGLDTVTRKVFESLPVDKAVSADSVVGDGISTAEAITSLTMLELQGLVSSLPGGLYIRK
jgi:DNA protecting protein DprA